MPSSTATREFELQRCIRDLAALNALQTMCIGLTPSETLSTILDSLPTLLSCDLIWLEIPGTPHKVHASLDGALVLEPRSLELERALAAGTDADGSRLVEGLGRLWIFDAELPIGRERGRLIAGRRRQLDADTDRVLIRSAANLAGATLEAANVLEAARRKDEFLAILGHELRNPLAPILTAVELLARNPSAVREQQVLERQARHLARLVDDLLDISRVTSGHVELRNEPVALSAVLERAVEIALPLVTRHRHELTLGTADDITLQGDPVRLAQVFANLLTNAAKFTPPGGKISVTVERVDPNVRVTVSDNGRGIARDQLQRIFEPFVQADRKSDGLRGGLGLGLAIVSNLVARHGGSISVHSEGRGHGASFSVNLPMAAPASRIIEKPPGRSLEWHAGTRVLVVDDNSDVADLLAAALSGQGFETAVAYDARSALERWASFAPHAGVLDVGLPELDGYELARRLRSEYGPTPLLIAITGYAHQKDRLRGADAGFDGYFVKPVSLNDIVSVLEERAIPCTSSAAGERSTKG